MNSTPSSRYIDLSLLKEHTNISHKNHNKIHTISTCSTENGEKHVDLKESNQVYDKKVETTLQYQTPEMGVQVFICKYRSITGLITVFRMIGEGIDLARGLIF